MVARLKLKGAHVLFPRTCASVWCLRKSVQPAHMCNCAGRTITAVAVTVHEYLLGSRSYINFFCGRRAFTASGFSLTVELLQRQEA
ncbi:hypothetical protein B0H14DRAFT_2836398 [Mycena olivaceomarginata]|nr:hypothetical protein B0H14DRAFT_2836398 [Mycena olivaceomarginata]